MNSIKLERVKFIPKELLSGVLYVSSEYAVAGHLCACGCGNKVITPLGPAEWTFAERNARPTMRPSIGNWQLSCRSHYLITDGHIEWASNWSDQHVAEGRYFEEQRRKDYYASLDRERGFWQRCWKLLRKFFGRK